MRRIWHINTDEHSVNYNGLLDASSGMAGAIVLYCRPVCTKMVESVPVASLVRASRENLVELLSTD